MTHEEKLSAELKPRLEALDQVVNKEFVKGNMDLLTSMKKYNKALTEVIAIRILADSKKIEIGGQDWDKEVAFQAKTVRESDAYVKMLDPVETKRFKELAEMARSGDIKNEYVKFVSSAKKEHQEPAMPKAAEKTTSAGGVGMKK